MSIVKASIGLVSFDSLGDSLVYLLIAENLRLNGFDVIFYSDVASEIKGWVPQLSIVPLSAVADIDTELEKYDLAIVSPPRFMRENLTDEILDVIREKWVLICHRAPDTWKYDHTARLRGGLSSNLLKQLGQLPRCGGSIRYRKFKHESVVDIALHFMREKMGLNHVERNVYLTIPESLQYQRYVKRIIISPDSAWPEKKDWSVASFLQLCRLLRREGFMPVIVVAPGNQAKWVEIVNNEFEVPIFNDVGELAAYIYESGALIANDSGNGHLASFLGIPVVTIYRKRNRNFHWRPSWGRATVVTPLITIPWKGDYIWRPFITPKMVFEHLRGIYID